MSHDNPEMRVEEIISKVLERRELGESISDEQVLATHPELEKPLRKKLKQLAIIAAAQKVAVEESVDLTIAFEAADLNDSTATKPSDVFTPGTQLKHFVLEAPVGHGGFGTVWRARDTKLDCIVAIKTPRRELSHKEKERFIKEASNAAQLRKHPNIVTVHDVDWEAGTPYIVSDFVDGEPLDELIDRSRVSFSEAVDLLISVCDGLQHAHDEGIIHRDLKPDNILLDTARVPHLTDFGLAKRESQMAAAEGSGITGTAAYMSPEQARGESDQADCRSDVFSIGVVMFELLTGEKPFRGRVRHVLQQIINKEAPPPRSFDSRVPADLQTICLKCLEKDPARRYQSADELRKDLLRFQRFEPIEAVPVTTAGRMLRWSQRNPSIPLLSISLMLVTVLATLVGYRFLVSEVLAMRKDLRQIAEGSQDSLAAYAADDAMVHLQRRFSQVRNLSEELQSSELLSELSDWNEYVGKPNISKKEVLDKFSQRKPPKGLENIQAFLPKVNTETYSFFICDRHGHQIARSPWKETLGTCYDYRSYVTGRAADDLNPSGEPLEKLAWKPSLKEPKLSGSFITDSEDAYVIAVSAPIWKDQKFQGVVGIFIELSKLVSDPGISPSKEKQRSMSIVDYRQDKPIRIFYRPFDEKEKELDLAELESVEPTIPNLESEGAIYTKDSPKWRTVLKPIKFVSDLDSGLYVMMAEKAETIEDPAKQLRTNLVNTGLLIVAFAAFVLVVIWVIILRNVVRT